MLIFADSKIFKSLMEQHVTKIQQIYFKLDDKTVSGHTVYRWLLDYHKSNGNVRSLIPRYTQKGRNNLKSSITEELGQYGKDQYLKIK